MSLTKKILHGQSNKSTTKKNMSCIRSKDTAPEKKLRSALYLAGFRFSKNVASLPGKPDIVLPKYKMIVFVNGCFWHQHLNCPKANIPKSNKEYWVKKLKRNVDRDKNMIRELTTMGWNVKIVWECEINHYIKKTIDSFKELQL